MEHVAEQLRKAVREVDPAELMSEDQVALIELLRVAMR